MSLNYKLWNAREKSQNCEKTQLPFLFRGGNELPCEWTFLGENVVNRLNSLIHTIYNVSFLLILGWNITQTCSRLVSWDSLSKARASRLLLCILWQTYWTKRETKTVNTDVCFGLFPKDEGRFYQSSSQGRSVLCKWRCFRLPLHILRVLETVWSQGKRLRKVSLGRKAESWIERLIKSIWRLYYSIYFLWACEDAAQRWI